MAAQINILAFLCIPVSPWSRISHWLVDRWLQPRGVGGERWPLDGHCAQDELITGSTEGEKTTHCKTLPDTSHCWSSEQDTGNKKTYIVVLEGDGSLLHGVSPPEVVCNRKSHQSGHRGTRLRQQHCLSTRAAVFGTCEGPQFDTAGHVVVEIDSSSFVVALDDGVQSLRTDTVS